MGTDEHGFPLSAFPLSAFAFRLQLPAIFRIFKTGCRCAWSTIEQEIEIQPPIRHTIELCSGKFTVLRVN
jgi:hypothetical protein